MGLEAGTYLTDLVATNPLGADNRSEGDDHLRLIKFVIQSTFPGFAGRFRRVQAKAAGYAPAVNDNASVLQCTVALALTFAAVATYGNGYELLVVADGGDVTLTPNGAEKINGQATFVIPDGYAGIVLASAIATKEFYCITAPVHNILANGADIAGNTVLTAATFGGTRLITASAIVTLPAVAGVRIGTKMLLKSITTGDVTIAPNGAETIDTIAASYRLPSFCEVEITKIGAQWIITRDPHLYVGELRPFSAALAAKNGWVLADFSAINRVTYAGLFATVGVAHGPGDGVNTFNVQDTRSRGLIGDGTGTTVETLTTITAAANAVAVASNKDLYITGMPVAVTGASGFAGLVNGSYFIIRDMTDLTHISFATTLTNAQNNVPMVVTGTGNATLTVTQATRTVGDRGGQDEHAETSTQQLAHLHGVGNWGPNTSGPHTTFNNQATIVDAFVSTTSTGGNEAMPIRNPYGVARFMVKT